MHSSWVRKNPMRRHGNQLQNSCLETPMDRGAWQAAVHGVAKSWTWLKQLSTHAHTVKWLTSSICWEWGEELVLIRAQRYCSVYPLRRNQDPAPRLLLPYFCIPSLPWLDCSNLLFQILKDDAVKVLHSICQQICKTQQWPQDWQRSLFIPIPKKDNAKECSNYHTIALISHTAK